MRRSSPFHRSSPPMAGLFVGGRRSSSTCCPMRGSPSCLAFTLPSYLEALYLSFGTTLDKFHGESAYRLPLSARYVVDPQGQIRAADVNADYTVRPDPEETLAQLRALSANSERQRPEPRMRM